MSVDRQKFEKALNYIGAADYSESEIGILIAVAKKCANTDGKIFGGTLGAIAATGVGVPSGGTGALPAWAVAGLTGFLVGSVACVNKEYPWKALFESILTGMKEPFEWNKHLNLNE